MDLVDKIFKKRDNFKSTIVSKYIDLEYDLGTLLAVDNNALDLNLLSTKKNDYLQDLARDNVQLLLNKICELPTKRITGLVVAKLPKQTYILPRAEHVRKPKPLTKWQEYSKLKGIQKKKTSKIAWDKQLQKWLPRYGHRRARVVKKKDWLNKVPRKANRIEDQFAKKYKTEDIAKNELQQLRNIVRSKHLKVPRMSVPDSHISPAKNLQDTIDIVTTNTIRGGVSNRKRKAQQISIDEVKTKKIKFNRSRIENEV